MSTAVDIGFKLIAFVGKKLCIENVRPLQWSFSLTKLKRSRKIC